MNSQTMSSVPNRKRSMVFTLEEDLFFSSTKLVVVMCGLPARGKSYITKKIRRYLSWMGIPTKDFNVGNHRRKKLRYQQDHTFFDQGNEENNNLRTQLALEVLEELITWLKQGGHVGIHDATNTTRARRKQIVDRIKKESNMSVLFIESVLSEDNIIKTNIELKLSSPDYRNQDKEAALRDFQARLENYQQVYEALDDEYDRDLSFIKLIDIGARVCTNQIHGYLPSQMAFFLMNYHIHPRKIWLVRHGESLDNVNGRIGGDSQLSAKGVIFAQCLKDFFAEKGEIKIWTSCLLRTIQTAAPLLEHLRRKGSLLRSSRIRALNEIYAGSCEGMTYNEIKERMPDEFEMRCQDKTRYRYPNGGESYIDLIERLKPLIIELERETSDVLVISHNAVARTIIGYFTDVPASDLPYIDIPLHQIVCLTPTPFGCEMEVFDSSCDIEQRSNHV